jgi:hypothetical protein
MTYTDYLMIGLFVCGAAMIVATIILLLRKGATLPKTIVAAVFSVLLLGLSAFGLPFLTAYGDWLEVVKPLLTQEATPELYAATMEKVARGGIDPAVSHVAVQTMISRPVPGMDKLAADALEQQPNAPGSGELARMKQTLDLRDQEVRRIADKITERVEAGDADAVGRIEALDTPTRIEVARELERRSAVQRNLDQPRKDLLERNTRLPSFTKP